MKIKVKAAVGVRVPREDNPRRYIETGVAEVDDSAYYLRRIADGDLLIVSEKTVTKAVKAEVSDGKS
ncbi:DUF2635 domain-containing protein [Pectobacterium actinidiae]|uniref:DUF2635 domain-containing protein n=1 Tax=Pectobacterium actinidiae TaxID=1507808 RepID=A0ABW8G7D1_9GAMM